MYIWGKCGQFNNYNVKRVGVYKYTFIVLLKLDEYWKNSLPQTYEEDRCLTKRIYFAIFPAQHYIQNTWRLAYDSLDHQALSFEDQRNVFFHNATCKINKSSDTTVAYRISLHYTRRKD